MRALVLAVSAVVLAVVVACSGKTACSAATCGTCCSSTGECVTATNDSACGSAGNMCAPCDTGLQCSGGKCLRSNTGGGAGGGSGGGSAGAGGASGGRAGGSTAGGSGGGSGGSSGGAAGGAGAVTCGAAPTTPTIPISFPPTCAAPSACGGNPAGMFFYTSACIPQTEFESYKTRIEQGCGPGSVVLRGFDGGMSGYAEFDGGTLCRGVTGGVTVYASIVSGICANATGCGLLNGQMIMGYSASCAMDAGACDCSVTSSINIDNAAHFTTGPTTLTVVGTNQTFETCLTGGMLSTREIDAGSAVHEPGVAGLTRQ